MGGEQYPFTIPDQGINFVYIIDFQGVNFENPISWNKSNQKTVPLR
jgi:hypothetical protein